MKPVNAFILVIDVDPDLRQSLTEILEGEGYAASPRPACQAGDNL
jgi:DNA-binding response OmpR family regulator